MLCATPALTMGGVVDGVFLCFVGYWLVALSRSSLVGSPTYFWGVAHNADSYARLVTEHSPIKCDRRALWAAVQSKKFYLAL